MAAGELTFDLPDQPDQEAGGFDFRHYLGLIKLHWRLIAVCIAVSCVVGLLMGYFAVPVYNAVATISVERDKVSMSDLGLPQSSVTFYDPDFLPTQLRIIRSRDVIDTVINRRQMLKEIPPAKVKGGTAETGQPSRARDQMARGIGGRLGVNIARGTTLIEIGYTANSSREAADMANAVAEAFIEWNRQSRMDQMTQVSRFLEAQIEDLKKDVDGKERRLADFGRSRDIVSMDAGKTMSMQKLDAFNKDYAGAINERVNKEARYQQVQAMSPESIADQDQSVAAARAEQQKLEREYAEKLSIWKPDFPAMSQLKARIDKGQKYLEASGRDAATKAREQARVELDAARKREEVLRGVVRSQTNETLGQTVDAAEYSNLHVEITASRTFLESMLKRQVETEVAARMNGMREANVRIVERAVPAEYRTYPSYRYNLQMGFLAGLLIGIGLVVMMDRMDRSIHSQEQVEKILKLPALGIIPALGGEPGRGYAYGSKYGYGSGYGYGYGHRYGLRYIYGLRKPYGARRKTETEPPPAPSGEQMAVDRKGMIDLIPHYHGRSLVAEAYRAFRAMLLLSRAGGLKSVVITSAIPGEGKTTTAVNLASALAQLNRKVLLVDADLHKPRIHEVLKITNRAGLVSLLAEGLPMKEVLQATPVANLWVLTTGPVTPNPSGLLSSPAMKSFLEMAKERFDYVIFDSPPVQPVADALILGSLTDGVVLTIHGGKTPREVVIKARRKLQRGNIPILGVLINNLRMTRPHQDEYGTYHGYEYGYGPAQPGVEEPPKKAEDAKAAKADSA